jgi:hypothetical protein
MMTRSLLRAIIQGRQVASTDRSTVEQSLRNGAKA